MTLLAELFPVVLFNCSFCAPSDLWRSDRDEVVSLWWCGVPTCGNRTDLMARLLWMRIDDFVWHCGAASARIVCPCRISCCSSRATDEAVPVMAQSGFRLPVSSRFFLLSSVFLFPSNYYLGKCVSV